MQRGLHEAWEIKLLPRNSVGNVSATSLMGVAGGAPMIIAMGIWDFVSSVWEYLGTSAVPSLPD